MKHRDINTAPDLCMKCTPHSSTRQLPVKNSFADAAASVSLKTSFVTAVETTLTLVVGDATTRQHRANPQEDVC